MSIYILGNVLHALNFYFAHYHTTLYLLFFSLTNTFNKPVESYGNILIMGDSNSEVTENFLNFFARNPACLKNANNLSFIDLLLTNQLYTIICSFYKIVVIGMKIHYNYQNLKNIRYRN